MKRCLGALTILVAALGASAAAAHPLAPALLDLHETAPGRYAALWRLSTRRSATLHVAPVLPDDCHTDGSLQHRIRPGSALEVRWTFQCTGGSLVGRTISATALSDSGVDVIVHIQTLDGGVIQGLLSPGQDRFAVPPPARRWTVFGSYLRLGIMHLLTGMDHMAFLLGLLLLVRRRRALIATITAFTLGHSVTLSLATLEVVRVPQALAELGIAGTILVLACELVRPPGGKASLLMRKPWIMSFPFGLIHGLGFAGALADIGLPPNEIPLSLLSFNAGLEVGQLALVTCAQMLATLRRQRVSRPSAPRAGALGQLLPAYAIGSLAAFWCFQRIAVLFA